MKSTRIVLASRPTGMPEAENFRTETVELAAPQAGAALLQTLYLSLDPYMRGRMSDAPSYSPPVNVDETMCGATVSRVVEAADPTLRPGDIVLGYAGWQTHSVEQVRYLRKLDPSAAPITTALGVLGMPGFTAYSGLLTIGRPQPGETVVVAAATGPVGATVGQIAKIKGARAVGIAGGPRKVALLREQFGFDAVIDHRAPDFAEQLATATPDGIDVYFENVGGAVYDAVLPRLNKFARIPVCGLIASYNDTELPPGPDRLGLLMSLILRKSLTLRGFIQTEFLDQFGEFYPDVTRWIAEGRIAYLEDVVDGLDKAVEAFQGLLTGKNLGKLVIKVAD